MRCIAINIALSRSKSRVFMYDVRIMCCAKSKMYVNLNFFWFKRAMFVVPTQNVIWIVSPSMAWSTPDLAKCPFPWLISLHHPYTFTIENLRTKPPKLWLLVARSICSNLIFRLSDQRCISIFFDRDTFIPHLIRNATPIKVTMT